MSSRSTSAATPITRQDCVTLASFRFALRKFMHFSAEAARQAGLSPQQHQALLSIKGHPDRDYVSISELSGHLHLKHHSVVGLVDRLAKRGLVKRVPSKEDRRKVHIHLTARGETAIFRLSAAHRDELRRLRPELQRLLDAINTSRA